MVDRQDKSLLAQYDDVFRGFDLNGCDNEFNVFAMNQYECQMKWLEVQKNILHVQAQINEAKKSTSKLELRNHHVNVLLKEEVKTRSRMQEEKREIQKQLETVREYLSTEANIREETKEKLHLLNCGRYPHLIMNNNARPIDKLDTITEVNSTKSQSSKSEDDLSFEDLEISGTVRSYRETIRNNKRSSKLEEKDITHFKPSCRKSTGTEMEFSRDECLIATTKVSVSQDGSTVATSTIESRPMLSIEGTSGGGSTISHSKKHCYKRQTIIRQVENCVPCGLRIKFGKPALKCINCGKSCHADCESRMPSTCFSNSCDMKSISNEELTSTQKPKGPLRFFSSPSTKN